MANTQPTVAQALTCDEHEKLDMQKFYLAFSDLTEDDIRLFFKRTRAILQRRIAPGLSLEQLGAVRDQISGLDFVQAQFIAIKQEQKTVDK